MDDAARSAMARGGLAKAEGVLGSVAETVGAEPIGKPQGPMAKEEMGPSTAAQAATAAMVTVSPAALADLSTRFPPAVAPSAFAEARNLFTAGNALRAAGAVVGGVALALTPSPTAQIEHQPLDANLRAAIMNDVVYGSIERKVDGVWTDTGVNVQRTLDGGLTFDRNALEAATGPLSAELAAAVPDVLERTSAVDPALSAHGTRARALVATAAAGMQNWQAHHLIGFGVVASLPASVQQSIAASGWQMDSLENLVPVPGDNPTYLAAPNNRLMPFQSGPHPNYDLQVATLMAPLVAGHATMSPQDIRANMATVEAAMLASITNFNAPNAARGNIFHPRLN